MWCNRNLQLRNLDLDDKDLKAKLFWWNIKLNENNISNTKYVSAVYEKILNCKFKGLLILI